MTTTRKGLPSGGPFCVLVIRLSSPAGALVAFPVIQSMAASLQSRSAKAHLLPEHNTLRFMFARGRAILLVLIIGLAVVALDFNKAFHIDDTFHLKAAQWIGQDPLHPMSGMVNWGSTPEPIHFANQPAGFFYLVAITGHLFGYSEAPMHAMRALFSLLAVFCFHRLVRERAPGQALWLTALFAFCPAFMVNQGLMTDVPLLALTLLHYRLLLAPVAMADGWRYFGAALALAAAVMIKYTALPWLLVFPLALLALGQRRWWPSCTRPSRAPAPASGSRCSASCRRRGARP